MRKTRGVFCKNGIWHIDYRTPEGRRRREPVGPSKKLAVDAYNKRMIDMAEGKFLDIVKKDKIFFRDFAQEYLDRYAKVHKKSWQSDEFYITHLNVSLGDKVLDMITPQDIDAFKAHRKLNIVKYTERTIKESSINRELAILGVIFNKAIEWGKLEKNPLKKVKRFKEPSGRIRFLEIEEIATLLKSCEPWLTPMVILACFAGMRRGEIFNLQWQDVDFRRGVITLPDTKAGELQTIPMNTTVKEALLLAPKQEGAIYVFPNKDGSKRTGSSIKRAFTKALTTAKINDFHFHDLRHTFASQTASSGVDLRTLQVLLRHKTIEMTLRYSHLLQGREQEAVEAISKKMDAFWTRNHERTTHAPQNISETVGNTQVK